MKQPKHTYSHMAEEKRVEAVFKLAVLRGETLWFYCQECRREVSQYTHPQMGERLIKFFNESCTALVTNNRGAKPYLVATN